jgi:hypothetical protein
VGIEASGHARWFERLLVELNFELWIGDATEIARKRERKQKTGCHDAQHILRLRFMVLGGRATQLGNFVHDLGDSIVFAPTCRNHNTHQDSGPSTNHFLS